MKTLYLCGPIQNCSDAEALEWRGMVRLALHDKYTILDPMRRDYRGKERHHATEIVEADLADINASDVVLVRSRRPSWGTAMELREAYRLGKRTVVVHPAGELSPWVRYHATECVGSLAEAIALLRE